MISDNLCKPDVINVARESMEMVVTEGTAKRVFAGLPFAVAGKTGTAHVSDGPIKYDHGVYQASFVGYFPADQSAIHGHRGCSHKATCCFTLWWYCSRTGIPRDCHQALCDVRG